MTRRGLFVTGTDTGVGKTQVLAALAALWAPRRSLVVRKPVETGCQKHNGHLLPLDAQTLAEASGQPDQWTSICPYRFQAAVSPARAARLNGQTLRLEQLIQACAAPREEQPVLVEGAGGFLSPLACDGLNADLAHALGYPVLVVAPNRLGCINHILLTLEAIASRNLVCLGVILNDVRGETDGDLNNPDELRLWTSMRIFELARIHQDPPWKYLNVQTPALVLEKDIFN